MKSPGQIIEERPAIGKRARRNLRRLISGSIFSCRYNQ